MNPAFQAAQAIGTNISGGFRKARDESAIESILSQAISSGDPQMLQDSIGKILSQVSPERQGAAIKYLENAYNRVQEKQKQQKEEAIGRQAAKEAGYTFGVPAQVAVQQIKDKAKQARLSQYGLVGDTPQSIPSDGQNIPQPTQSPFSKMSQEQLIIASGAPEKEISEPAKAQLKVIEEDKKLEEEKKKERGKRSAEITQPLLKRADEIAETLPLKESTLGLMENALINKDMSFFSQDNIAELSGIEGFRSKEGAIFKTAGKEYFLGNIRRAGARPNQWIEQQIADMMAKVGRDTAANLSVTRAFRNELDLEKKRVELTESISKELEDEYGNVSKELGPRLNKEILKYAEEKQQELYNDLRAIKAIDEKKTQKFLNVKKGTPVSKVVAQALLRKHNNDPLEAANEAKRLGYQVE